MAYGTWESRLAFVVCLSFHSYESLSGSVVSCIVSCTGNCTGNCTDKLAEWLVCSLLNATHQLCMRLTGDCSEERVGWQRQLACRVSSIRSTCSLRLRHFWPNLVALRFRETSTPSHTPVVCYGESFETLSTT